MPSLADGTATAELPTLLLVLPGAVGRRPMLNRLQASFRLCALVTSENLTRCSWARDFLGADLWIECGRTDDIDSAWAAVQAWLGAGAGRHLEGVLCYDEFGIELSANLAERLKVPGTPVSQIRAACNKLSFRERCQACGVPTVRHALLRSEVELDALLSKEVDSWSFPCVLKPVKGAGSYHISRVDSPEELRTIFPDLMQQLKVGSLPDKSKHAGLLLEEYFAGHEVDVDGWARHGAVEFCLVSDNRPAKEPHFLELGGIYPSQLPKAHVEALERLTSSVVAAFPGYHGAFHFEAKVSDDGAVMPIELNARLGGAECPSSTEAVTGLYLPDVAARLALDLPVSPLGRPRHNIMASTNLHHFETGVIAECSKEAVDVEGLNVVSCEVFGSVGHRHVPNGGSLSCLGWIATGGSTVAEAESNLQRAISQVRIVIQPNEANGEPPAKRAR